jgi:DNA/RNA-binding domain of Phe-tRNA-synthetase-like protein
MKILHIDTLLKEHCPNIRLGLLYAEITVREESPVLWQLMLDEAEKRSASLTTEDISKIPTVAAARKAYKLLGKDPSRYRPSAEALLRRIVSGKGLYAVNNVVNLINLISFKSGFSIGGYDPDSIQGDIVFGKGLDSDHYEGLGRGLLNIENLPVLRDEISAFGCPTSDSERTGIRNNSKSCLWVFFDFDCNPDLEKYLQEASELLEKFAEGSNFSTLIVS